MNHLLYTKTTLRHLILKVSISTYYFYPDWTTEAVTFPKPKEPLQPRPLCSVAGLLPTAPRLASSSSSPEREQQCLPLQTTWAVSGACDQDCFIRPQTGGSVCSSSVPFEQTHHLGQVSWLWVRALYYPPRLSRMLHNSGLRLPAACSDFPLGLGTVLCGARKLTQHPC